jgi:hypothetical protein
MKCSKIGENTATPVAEDYVVKVPKAVSDIRRRLSLYWNRSRQGAQAVNYRGNPLLQSRGNFASTGRTLEASLRATRLLAKRILTPFYSLN